MYNINIREESFGATLNNIETGKREYITHEELENIMTKNVFPADSVGAKISGKPNIKYTKKALRSRDCFSFADIAFLELTRACNLKCSHCLNASGKAMDNQLTYEEVEKLVVELADCGLQELRLTGGEPLLFPGIVDIIKIATDNGLYVSLGTNGTLVTRELAEKLKNAGLKKAVVSIDGNVETHDSIRGEGNYEKAFNGLIYLRDAGIRVRINSVIMKTNMDDIVSFAKKVNELEIPLFIRRFISSGRGEDIAENMMTAADYSKVREQLKEELENSPYVNGHYLRNDEGIIPRIPLPFEIRGCKAGQRAIAIMPNGDVNLCGFLAAQGFNSVGNIRNILDWEDFWYNIQENDFLKKLRNDLAEYNSIPNIQETYCLGYVQNRNKVKQFKR